jgi:Pentapeptide repeats (8 copies)
MANIEQLELLNQSVEIWNEWREHNVNAKIDLRGADLAHANLSYANLKNARLSGADLSAANLYRANLRGATVKKVQFDVANLREANLTRANLEESGFWQANLRQADLKNAQLSGVAFDEADLTGADLRGADLRGAYLVSAKIDQANVSKTWIHGINIWDLEGEFGEQEDLILTRKGEPLITVDTMKIAQFIDSILNNEETRNGIDSLTPKSVLLLGRFAIPERKAILDALRNKLREYNLLPIVFDFDHSTDKDFAQTIKTLAGLSYFVIADLTNPRSAPLELQAKVPDYQIPFVPIIQEGEQPFAMMKDLKKYGWVLDTISYDSLDTLLEILKPHIIDPAIQKRDELRLIKAKEPTVISGRALRDQGRL